MGHCSTGGWSQGQQPKPGETKNELVEAHSAARGAICNNETGTAHPASPSRFRTCTANARINKSRPRRGRAVNSDQRSHYFSFGVSDLCLGRVGKFEAVGYWGLLLASALTLRSQNTALCFVKGTVTLDVVSLTMKIGYISRATLD